MNINEYIDSTNLSKTAIADDIMELCEDAKKYHFQAVRLFFCRGSQPTNLYAYRTTHGLLLQSCSQLQILRRP